MPDTQKALDGVVGRADDRFFVDVEGGVDDGVDAGFLAVMGEEVVDEGMRFLVNKLRARGAVDVDDGGTRFFHGGRAGAGDGHEGGGMLGALEIFVTGGGVFRAGHGGKRHELGAAELGVEILIDGGMLRFAEHGAIAEGARPEIPWRPEKRR